ncbi:MAG: hypothetical protein KBC44_03325 [Candidatus Pacebacteria bacterium]|nr:hypothetical protein [Candidatus Paceibacterota bacterium]
MNNYNEVAFKGLLRVFLIGVAGILISAFVALLIFGKPFFSEQNVSGVVYNTTNNGFISGNTNFKIRASVDTYINENNESSYCLPPNSQYKELVNKAASDKNIKVQVTTKKGFWWAKPWTCIDNIEVREIK